MSYHDLSLLEIVCCPETESKLEALEPWLFSPSEGDHLYPKLCHTPILQPRIDHFLKNESLAVSRAFAEYGDDPESREWFYSRYGFFNAPDPSPLDTEVLGEGYPGFWDSLHLPQFIQDLDVQSPESYVLDLIGNHHPKLGLDLGCGQGGMLQQMAAICGQAIGLERHFYLAATANRLLKQERIPIRYFDPVSGYRHEQLEKKAVQNAYVICGDILKPPFSEPLFDWVHCGHILDLIPNPAAVLRQIQRILKPGGILSICSPWDFEEVGHFHEMLEILNQDFENAQTIEGIPWLRLVHKRRFVLHEDWIWVGKHKLNSI